MKPLPPLQILREFLSYDQETGVFTWKKRTGGTATKGVIAGNIHGSGYIVISFKERNIRAHRLAWLFVHGDPGNCEIDHINGNRTDNRISNLRAVPRTINQQNLRGAKSHNKCGFLGVRQVSSHSYCASIKANNKTHWLGCFETPKQAHEAYLRAKRRLHEGCSI